MAKPAKKIKKIARNTVKFENPDVHLQEVDLSEVMSEAFGRYSKYELKSRSIPDVRDGLLPVQRRTLFSMYKGGYHSKKPTKKSAKIVGEIMGNYHPHGDCKTPDTTVFLLNNQIKTLRELSELGGEHDVLAIDKNGEIVPAKAHSFRVGQYATKIYHLRLNTGVVVKVTGNHPFRTIDGDWVKAEDMKPYTVIDYASVSMREGIYKSVTGYKTRSKRLHQLITDYIYGESEGMVTHHINENKLDNTPENLEILSRGEHAKLHKDYLTGLEMGRKEMFSPDGKFYEKTKEKNSKLSKSMNKFHGVIKANATLNKMKSEGKELTLEVYETYRPSTYNLPKIDRLIAKGQIRSFEDLIELNSMECGIVRAIHDYHGAEMPEFKKETKSKKKETTKKEYQKEDISPSISRAYAKVVSELGRVPELSELSEIDGSTMLVNLVGNYFADKEDLYKEMALYLPIVEEITIEILDEQIPMYDYTVEEHENLLFSASKDHTVLASSHNSGIYGALARMSKPWIMGSLMVFMQGNNGSVDGDNEAAMRYCITGDSLLTLADGSEIPIQDVVPDSELNTTTDIQLSVMDYNGLPVNASKFFNSGSHEIKEMVLKNGKRLKGSFNHPVLTLFKREGKQVLDWKLLENLSIGDYVAQYRNSDYELTDFEKEVTSDFPNLDYKNLVFTKVSELNDLPKEVVYSIRVDSEDHSFIANGIVNHNTESRLTEYSEDILLSNLALDGLVPFVDNYDDSLKEPVYLPAKMPNILINGSLGIAVGYATSIPTFNISETLDACIAQIKNPNIEDSELVTYIPSPDLPTGGTISGFRDYQEALISGRGTIKVRGNYHLEQDSKETVIVFTEIPYGVTKPSIIAKVGDAIDKKEVYGINEIRDESDKDGIRLTIYCDKEANIDAILSFLFSKTPLMSYVALNANVISDGRPKTLGVPKIIREFNQFRLNTFVKGIYIQIQDYMDKKHVAEGFVILLDNLEEVIKTIRASTSKDEAQTKIMEQFGFSDMQAKRILGLSLHRLSKTDNQGYIKTIEEANRNIDVRKEILSSEENVREAVVQAYEVLKEKYGVPRKTALVDQLEVWDYTPELVIQKENMVVGVTEDGFIKVSNTRSYGASTVDNSETKFILETDTTQSIILVDSKGGSAYIPVHRLPLGRWADKGKHLSTFGLDTGANKIAFVGAYDGLDKDISLFLLKNNGVGKQTPAFDYVKTRGFFSLTSGIRCKDDEEVIGGYLIDNSVDNYLAIVDNQNANMYFETKEMPVTAKTSGGSSAIRLNKKQGRFVKEHKLYSSKEEIPEFCEYRERGSSGWNRPKTAEPISLYTEEVVDVVEEEVLEEA